jgi:hypothetical protein
MLDRAQECWIDSSQPCELLGITSIGLPVTLGDQGDSGRVGDHDLMAESA